MWLPTMADLYQQSLAGNTLGELSLDEEMATLSSPLNGKTASSEKLQA
ncbi:MAG: hypothetical protein U5K69_19090 [Balneolaceae bacterium]|nr:hypothetical protein [Balneolaceae bacterium]